MKNCLIMTSSIIVDKRMPYHLHVNVNERIRQYIDALIFYIVKSNFSDIVFCDWSWFPLQEFDFLYKLSTIYNKNLEFLSFNNNQEKVVKKWKWYWEGKIIEYALDNSKLLKNQETFYKVTGRYIVENINDIINRSSHTNYFCKITTFNNKVCNTAFFKSSKDFYNTALRWAWNKVYDKWGIYLEHIYMKILKNHKKEIHCFKEMPYFIWVSWTDWTGITPNKLIFKIGELCNRILWLYKI